MKKLFFLFFSVIFMVSIYGKAFTLMIYICGDNNLSSAINDDIDEIEAAYGNLTSNLDIVICVDGHPSYGGYVDEGGTRTDTRYYHLSGGGNGTDGKINDLASVVLGEKNMSDPQTLIDFVDWAEKNYSASNYGLIIWNHGAGWAKDQDMPLKGGVSDDTDGDFMSGASGEWREALEGARNQIGKDFYFIGCDMCVMAYMEVLWDMYDLADMVVYSEANIPFAGWYYNSFITSLATSAPTSHAWLGHLIVNDYKTYYGSSTENTLTYNVINNTEYFNGITENEFLYLRSQIFNLAKYLIIDEGGRDASDVQACIDGTQPMSSGTFYQDFKDLYHFCYLLNTNGTIGTRVKTYAVNIMNIIDKMNPEDWQNGFSNSHGLGIYMPDDKNIYYFEQQYYSSAHRWGASSLYNGSVNGACYTWTNFIYGATTTQKEEFEINYDFDIETREVSFDYVLPSNFIGVQIVRNDKIIFESGNPTGRFKDKLDIYGNYNYRIIGFTFVDKIVVKEFNLKCEERRPIFLRNKLFFFNNSVDHIDIYNRMGKKIFEKNIKNLKIVDLSFLKNGIYFVDYGKGEKDKIMIIK
ncbi:MAG: clostripain-related cysteine peptidase [candidate division WOR-3 bacterium]